MSGSRTPRRPSGLDIGRLTAELHKEFSPKPDTPTNPDMRRWNSRKGKPAKRKEARRALR